MDSFSAGSRRIGPGCIFDRKFMVEDSHCQPLILLGATGSIGTSTVDLVRRHRDRFRIVAATADRRGEGLALLARDLDIPRLCISDPESRSAFLTAHPDLAGRLAAPGMEGILECIAEFPQAMVLNALVGAVGLEPTLAALQAGQDVALANKEALVVGGSLVLDASLEGGGKLWPVDSEHSAIAQCLRGNPGSEVARLWLTASGGSFRDWKYEDLEKATLEDVLRHPNWDMGPKITVDSATMMNKGLEVLEAHLLFGIALADIQVVVHRQSIIHSMVEMRDGAFLAQMGIPDMRIPILFALARGEHWKSDLSPYDPRKTPILNFEEPDLRLFPCLSLAREAGERGGAASIVLNAANEEAVAGLLRGEISFMDIPRIIRMALDRESLAAVGDLEEALQRDQEVRCHSRETVDALARNKR